MTVSLIPRFVLSSPRSARLRVGVLAGAGAAACSLAGVWPRFADGLLFRGTIATTSALFGALVAIVSLGAKQRSHAVGRAIGLSTILGFASTILPSAILASQARFGAFVAFLVFGLVFGSITGFLYGLYLALLAGVTWAHARAGTHDATDRATRNAAVWTLPPALLALAVALTTDAAPVSQYAGSMVLEANRVAAPLGLTGALVALALAVVALGASTLRIATRRAWLAHVASGADPRLRVRELSPHDDVAALPRLVGSGAWVLEETDDRGAYRTAASGRAVARIAGPWE